MKSTDAWGRSSRRVRVLAAALAIAMPVLVFAIVNVAWQRNKPPRRPPPTSVEVRIIESPTVAAPPAAPAR